MKKFQDLPFFPINDAPFMVGKKARMHFDNGYGVSVVSHTLSYGGKNGLYELAVLDSDGITYSTEVTSDVLGHLTEENVTEHMIEVQNIKTHELTI